MNQLQVINRNGQFLVDSREVAEMIGKEHSHLLRDIRGYVNVLEDNPILDSRQFFIESTYMNLQNKEQPCYLLTRKGCDMVANKMTGHRGVNFTAVYVTKFEEMEKQQNLSMDGLSPMLQLMIQTELKQKLLEEKQEQLESKITVLTENLTAVPDHNKVIKLINEYVRWTRLGHNEVYNRIYDILQDRHGHDVRQRVENERNRLNEEFYRKNGRYYSESTLKGKVNGIDIMVRMGVLDKFYEILVGLLAQVKNSRKLG